MNLYEIVEVADPEKDPLWARLAALGQQIPEEEWETLPSDLSRNFEHYVYGASKE
jgi:hypothetical protein